MDPRTVRVVGGPQQPGHPDPFTCRRQVEPHGAIAPLCAGGGIRPRPLDLSGSPRAEDDAPVVEPAVDALCRRDPADLSHCLAQRRAHGSRCSVPGFAGQGRRRHRPQRRDPPTVAPAGAEPDVLGLQDHHRQRGVQPEQVVGRPQSRVATAHDGDVNLGRRRRGIPHRGARGPGRRRYAALPPQRPAHRCASAPSNTERSLAAMSSNSVWPMMSGGASWMTGSPRSSARQ